MTLATLDWSPEDNKFYLDIDRLASTQEIERHRKPIEGFIRTTPKWPDPFSWALTASLQNVERLQRQLKQGSMAYTARADRRIAELRAESADMQSLRSLQSKIKSGDMPINIDYPKLKPLAPYQDLGVKYLAVGHAVPLFADCGVGKTFMVLTSTEYQLSQGWLSRGKTLVLGKLATLHSGWLKDTEKFTTLKTEVLWIPATSKRKEKLANILKTSDADIFVMNHEGVHNLVEELAAHKFEKVVVDESTILKSFKGVNPRLTGGKFGQALMRIAEHANYRVIMSGTPAPNGVQDLWGQFKFLDPAGVLLEPEYRDFRAMYMKQIHFGNPDDPKTPSTWVPRSGSDREVANIVRDYIYRVRLRDHLMDLPPITISVRSAKMGPTQAKAYDEMETSFATTLDDETIAVGMQLAAISKLRQITGGFVLDANEVPHVLPDGPKLGLLDSLLEDEIRKDEKVVIFAQYQWEIKELASRYKDHGVVTVYGGNHSNVNINNIERFLKDQSIRLIILHPRSAAHGVTLTNAHYLIFYSSSYSAEEDYQSIKRIERAGQKNAMFVYYLHCDDTIDGIMHDVIHAKSKGQACMIDEGGRNSKDVEEIWARLREKLRRRKYSKSRAKGGLENGVQQG